MAIKRKKRRKIKSSIIKMKRFFRNYKTPIFLCLGLMLFPIIVGLFYKIPINFISIEIGDLLSFYAVALGLFATYLTYRENENKKFLARQESLQPRIELELNLDNDWYRTEITLRNSTENDYILNYVECDYYEDEEKRYLNAKNTQEFFLDSWNEIPPNSFIVGLKDNDGNNWLVGFEHQEESTKYCRTFIDLIN